MESAENPGHEIGSRPHTPLGFLQKALGIAGATICGAALAGLEPGSSLLWGYLGLVVLVCFVVILLAVVRPETLRGERRSDR